jgi:hypothetical protein
MKLSSSRLNRMDGAKMMQHNWSMREWQHRQGIPEGHVFNTLVGETRPVATKLMVCLAKTLCTWCTDAFAKFNGNRCIRQTNCQTMAKGTCSGSSEGQELPPVAPPKR